MSDRDATLSKETKVQVGLVLSIVGALFAFHVWLDGRLDELEMRLTEIEMTSERASHDRWTRAQMADWVEAFGRANPELAPPRVTRGN